MINKLQYFIYTFLAFILFSINGFTQAPINDRCGFAEDISDGLWHPGDNTDAFLNCNSDHRTGNCGDFTTSGCNSGYEFTNATDMCCGIEGIESSLWYSFTIPANDTVYVDFRNISCNPVTFFTVTTTLQGFLLLRSDSAGFECGRPCWDTTMACFNATNTLDIDGQMMAEVRGGREYKIMIDTKKNSFTSCGGCPGAPNCHSNCTFEIRIRRANPPSLKNVNLDLKNVKEGVEVKWYLNEENSVLITRKDLESGVEENVTTGNLSEYKRFRNRYEFLDDKITRNGNYLYSLYSIDEYSHHTLEKTRITQVKGLNYDDIYLSPNPTNGMFKIVNMSLEQGVDKVIRIYNVLGDLVSEENMNSAQEINLNSHPSGIYFVVFTLGGKVVRKKIVLDK